MRYIDPWVLYLFLIVLFKAHYMGTVWQMKLRLLHCSPGRGRHKRAIGPLQNALSTKLQLMGKRKLILISYLVSNMLVATERILDGEMANILPDDELEAEIQGADEYKERLYRVLAKLKKALEAPSSAAAVSPAPLLSVRHPTPADSCERSDPSTTEPASLYRTRYI